MKKNATFHFIFLVLLVLIPSTHAHSQNKGDYNLQSKALNIGVYNPKKAVKNSHKVFHDEEADKEFDKLLQKDTVLRNLHTDKVTDDNGNTLYIRENEVSKYYPKLGIILETGGHGYCSASEIRTKRDVCGDPATYAYSPSRRYRFSGLYDDGMRYFLEEKINGIYVCLGRVHGTYGIDGISGYYWVDEKTIHYLQERKKEDGTKYWVAYSARFVRID